MRRIVLIISTLAVLAAATFISSRIPFPESKGRDAVGKKHFTTTMSSRDVYYLSLPSSKIKSGIVALVASAGREASDFNELVEALNKSGYVTITVEAPGLNGAEVRSKSDSSMHYMSLPLGNALEDVRTVLSAPSEPIFLIGHAFGNRVVRTYASIQPRSIKAVILLAAGGENEIDPVAEKALKNIFNSLAPFKKRKKDVAYAFFSEGNEIPYYWLRGWHTKTAIMQSKAKNQNIERDWQDAGGVPMLVVQPAQDRIAPKEVAADYLTARFPDQVEVVVIENAGHALLPEQLEAVAEAVIEFLDRQSAK